jgi:hypothetical protein
MVFATNYVFIDEASFHINMKASRAWTPRGQMVVVNMSSVSTINLSTRVPKQQLKLRNIQGDKKRKSPLEAKGPKGTTVGHYLSFLKRLWIL